ncbi:MAG: adenosylcobinamide-GDP ribazoletransferase [Candidatus Scalindua sp.]|nr:adenosylcobinamide-GDP ribazoletransferase [Candidatus Scalindua sp.]
MKHFIWTLRFLTIVPIVSRQQVSPPRISNVAFWFPIVGLIIGIALTCLYLPALQLFSHLIADALVLTAYIIMTGGYHLDGLADTFDGLFGGNNREKRLKIMRDSRIGTYGVLCLVVTIGLKYLCIASIGSKDMVRMPFFFDTDTMSGLSPTVLYACEKGKILFLMCAVGRWSQILSASVSTYARDDEGTGRIIVDNLNLKHLLISSCVPLILIFFFCGMKGIFVLFIVMVTSLIFTSFVKGKIGGMTGDTLGAVNEISELTFLLSVLAL